ncbi:MFS general substrate transporter [Penicillium lividum]|nr:MFS general substrate transporter [Penicillium lividum]
MANITEVTSLERSSPPGTFLLIREDDYDLHSRVVMLDPVPTSDPNEPLNWSTARKTVNFTIVLGMTVVIFAALSVQTIFWQEMVVDLHTTYADLNKARSVNFVGLASGCFLFIPFAKKYGRRPIYIISTILMVATSFWSASLHGLTGLYVANLLQGLAGATNEAIVEITIADLFFVHHRGRMNGLYMTMVMIGSFLAPMAAGAQATNQGWRWSYITMGIFNAIFLVLFIFVYEETKYVPLITGQLQHEPDTHIDMQFEDENQKKSRQPESKPTQPTEPSTLLHELDPSIPMNTWRKRLALATPTPETIWPYYYRPFYVLLTFPAVMYTALQYASGVVLLTILSSVLSLTFPLPPYSFNSEQIGFMSVGPFIGNLIGSIYGGVLGDWSIMYFSRRNKGFFEPEMRLYILPIPAVFMSGGLIMFGTSIARGMHWIYPSIAGVFFGFGLGSISDAALTLVIDSYREMTGDAFTGIAFMRNAVSIGIPFAITPWIERNGTQNMFIACGFISLGITSLMIPMILWGKDARRASAARYYRLVQKQGSARH